jgi:hypothetical protein
MDRITKDKVIQRMTRINRVYSTELNLVHKKLKLPWSLNAHIFPAEYGRDTRINIYINDMKCVAHGTPKEVWNQLETLSAMLAYLMYDVDGEKATLGVRP